MASASTRQSVFAKWRAWSLPNKLTAIGAVLSAIGLFLAIYLSPTATSPWIKQGQSVAGGNDNIQITGDHPSLVVVKSAESKKTTENLLDRYLTEERGREISAITERIKEIDISIDRKTRYIDFTKSFGFEKSFGISTADSETIKNDLIAEASEQLAALYDQHTEQSKLLDRMIGATNEVIIDAVLPGTQASTLGLQKGDIIISYNRTPIKYSSELQKSVLLSADQEHVDMFIARDGNEKYLQPHGGTIGIQLKNVKRAPPKN